MMSCYVLSGANTHILDLCFSLLIGHVYLLSIVLLLVSFLFFFLMIRRPPRSTLSSSSAASDVYKRQEHDITGTLYILEDTSKGIKKALSMDEGFASKFTEKISVPIFTNDELVLFAKSYSAELGYKIDEMAILALHNRISNIERIDQATTLTEVKDIIDEAIDREAHSGLKKAISILTARRYTDDDRIVLKEDHFREK